MSDRLKKALAQLDAVQTVDVRGRVTALTGVVLRATMPGVRVGDHLRVRRPPQPPLEAEVVGFADQQAILMPLGDPTGIPGHRQPLSLRLGRKGWESLRRQLHVALEVDG